MLDDVSKVTFLIHSLETFIEIKHISPLGVVPKALATFELSAATQVLDYLNCFEIERSGLFAVKCLVHALFDLDRCRLLPLVLLLIHFPYLTELLLEVSFLVVPRVVIFLFLYLLFLLFALLGLVFDLACKAGVECVELSDDAGHHKVVAECHREEVPRQVEGIIE